MKSTLLFSFTMLIGSAFAQFTNDFDENTGTNSYSGLSAGNWVDVTDGLGIAEQAGFEFFASANGNATGTFSDRGITKTLGGTIEDHPYRVSFYIAVYNDGSSPLVGVEYSDFSLLKIGGPNGTMVWDSVPTPTVYGQWVEWSGTYTPDASDLGQPFTFECLFDLDGYHSVAFDGPFTMVDPTLGVSVMEQKQSKKLVKIVDALGRESDDSSNQMLFYIYDDGSMEKRYTDH
ncbi:MAG: hypothetical protein ACFHU9_08310 [Fluviicola sp.]